MFDEQTVENIATVRPIKFILLYLGLTCICLVFMPGSILPYEISYAVMPLISAIMIVIIYGWMIFASHYIKRHSIVGKFTKLKKLRVHFYLLLLFVALLPIKGFVEQTQTSFALILVPITYLYIYILWSTARTLVYAEEQKKVTSSKIIGTAFQLFYLPFCYYWLHKRMLKLPSATKRHSATSILTN